MTFNTLASPASVSRAAASLMEHNITVHVVETKEAALEKVKSLIPPGADVMTGGSVTLEQIGFVALLQSGRHSWVNRKESIVHEKDPLRQRELRRQSILAQYFLGSVHAITEEGQLIIASNTGSQLPSFAFSSPNVIWIAGTQKIVPTLQDGMERIQKYVFPQENQRMKDLGFPGSAINKLLVIERETPMLGRSLHLVLVKEVLGF